MKTVLLCALLFFSPRATAQSALAPNAPVDKPVGSSSEQQHKELLKAIGPYVEQAKKTWPAAKENYLRGLPPRQVFFVTTELVDARGKREIVFVEVQKIEKGMVTGLIANEISTVSGFKAGQAHRVPENNILDWTISKPDGSEEGNLVGKFLESYRPTPPVIPDPDKAQLTFLENRGRELAARVRIEAAARAFLEGQGFKTKGISSPVIVSDGTRWLIFFEKDLGSPYVVMKALECRMGDLGDMKGLEGVPLPKAAEGMAEAQLTFKRQLKDLAREMYEIPVDDGNSDFSLYLFPRQMDPNEITIGRDMKMSYISSQTKPWVVTTFHQAVHKVRPKDLQKALPAGATEPGFVHNHALSDYPTETDVVLAMLFPSVQWHTLGKQWHFLIGPDGTIRQVPMPQSDLARPPK
ncbi:DUF2314 domain-containing protein [Geothrix campi]|jgi:hypothetical protein|uniref:DUF2314 domain-containing protein n=1 Tax=Geothrix campi TaxID=2966450 RepID=UPI002149373E|nr:DUF2314 domain-containing protein [Geothrix sp. SG10]